MNNNEMMTITDGLLDLLINIQSKLIKPNEIIKGCNMPLSHMKVIFYLANKKTTSVSNLAKFLDISKPNMTPIIDNLITEGLVIRYTDPKDRRKYNVELTEKGFIFINEKKIEMKSKLTNRLLSLKEEDLMQLNSIIKDMNEIILKLE
ncbi:MAG: MarR family transcriptional regulator [Clostridium sartagoforme]|nr:MarR family transcriptional regulator [Clostridium sartagoforme]